MEKNFNKGLVLGKFMPPHNGHLHLINTAIEQCNVVYVLICSLINEQIDGKLRAEWLKTIYKDQANVIIIHCEDENPQHPSEVDSLDEFYNDFWVPTVYSRVDSLDVVFTSETYGDEFAKYLGIQHVLVDIERVTYPVSGTKVRTNAYKYWDYIPDVVKQYFTKRIAIMGPESTGKTTLTQLLSNYFNVDHVLEYGRTYVEEVKASSELISDDFFEIAIKHNQLINDALTINKNMFLFVDTEAITTKIFGGMYVKNYLDNRLDDIISSQHFDLYLLLDVDVPWVDDGTRDFPHERVNHFNKIKNELEVLNKNFVIIKGDYNERFNQARECCQNLIEGNS